MDAETTSSGSVGTGAARPDLRVGDDDRRAVDARLQQAVGEGRLSLQEYEERAGQVWAARTASELTTVVDDLPGRAPAPQRVEPAPPVAGRTRRVLAVMSGDELRGPVEGQVEAYAVMGGATVDLRRDDLPAHVRVRAVAVMGGVEVLVPRGVTVHLSGLSLMGGRDARVDPAVAGAPVVEVSGFAVMGGITVGHGSRPGTGDVPQGAPDGSAVSLDKHPGDLAHPGARTTGSRRLPEQRGHRPDRATRRHPRRGRVVRFAVAGAVLLGLAVGVPAVATADQSSVFGSSVVHLDDQRTDRPVDVGVLFGSVKVVVPDDATVTSEGTVVFGSTTCETACARSSGGPHITVHSRGGFGSVDVVTVGEEASGG